MEATYFGALVAGLVSFLSPCVLPLVPGYISMLSGIGVDKLRRGEGARGTLLASAVCFVVGFSLVFVSLGAGATTVGSFLRSNRSALAPVAGAVIVLFGLHLVGWLVKIPVRAGLIVGALIVAAGVAVVEKPGLLGSIRPIELFSASVIFLLGPYLSGWLSRDVHMRNVGGQPGMVGAFLLGFAFAFGWTPCIGPILGSILLYTSSRADFGQGLVLLLAYSLGLAIPFLVAAWALEWFLGWMGRFRRYVGWVERIAGVLLIAFGLLLMTGTFTVLSGWLQSITPELLRNKL